MTLSIPVITALFGVAALAVGVYMLYSAYSGNKDREIRELRTKLAKAEKELADLDRLERDFIGLAIHQIRAPLTAIKGYISLIKDGDYGPLPESLKTPLDIVFRSTNNLVNIVGDFLDVSRIDHQRMSYAMTTVDLVPLIDEIKHEVRPLVESVHLNLLTYVEPHASLMVHADRDKLKQVIVNMLDNAVKYTPKGSITLSVERGTPKPHAAPRGYKPHKKQHEVIRIAVKDSGIGMNPDSIPRIFAKFTRLKGASKVNIIGTGLGLYIAKEMIEAQHGRLWAESAGPGKGSQFYVELRAV